MMSFWRLLFVKTRARVCTFVWRDPCFVTLGTPLLSVYKPKARPDILSPKIIMDATMGISSLGNELASASSSVKA